jgi:hypothetical protein
MIDYIQIAFRNILNNSEWMDGPSKEKALAKVIRLGNFQMFKEKN